MAPYDKSKTPESWLIPYQEYGRYSKGLQISDLESNREAHKLHAWHLEQQAKARSKMKMFKALTFAASFIPFGGVATSVLAKVGMQSAGLAAKFLTKTLVKSMGKFVTSRFLAETVGFKPKEYHSEVKYRKDLVDYVNEHSKRLGVQKPKFGDAFASALSSEFTESIIKPGKKIAKTINENASATDIIKQQSKLFKKIFGFGEGSWKFKGPTEVSDAINITDVALENLKIEDISEAVEYSVDYGEPGKFDPYSNQSKDMYKQIIGELDKEGILKSSPEFADLSLTHMPIQDVSELSRDTSSFGMGESYIKHMEYNPPGTPIGPADISDYENLTGTGDIDYRKTGIIGGEGGGGFFDWMGESWNKLGMLANIQGGYPGDPLGSEDVDFEGKPWQVKEKPTQYETYTPWYENLTEEETSFGFGTSPWNKNWKKREELPR
jgi:hypothetical protein